MEILARLLPITQMKTFDQIADIVLDQPGVDSARTFIQATRGVEVTRVGRVPSSDTWQNRRERKTTYRCFVKSEKGPFAERSGTDLLAVVREAFKEAGLPEPAL
jgi:hypothetical protein